MKPSERIKQILSTPVDGMFTSETGAILEYLDEQHDEYNKFYELATKKLKHTRYLGTYDGLSEQTVK